MADGYIFNDRRGHEPPKEACVVCGCTDEVHSSEYNTPTMKCIEFLRKENLVLLNRIHQLADK